MFETFWSHYPARNKRKLGKVQAALAFALLDDEDQALCIRAAKHYAKACQPKAGEFVPMARDAIRFLKQDWWRDWIEGDVAQCNFRVQPPCEQPVEEGQEACAWHLAYRAKLARVGTRA